MQDPNASPVCGGVNHFVGHLYSPDCQIRRVFEKIADKHIVIAGDEYDARAFARLAQEFLNHIIVRLRPVPALFQLPAINNIADQINTLRFVVRQKVQQGVRLTILRTQMDIGQPQGAVVFDLGYRRLHWWFKLVHLHDFPCLYSWGHATSRL